MERLLGVPVQQCSWGLEIEGKVFKGPSWDLEIE
jgi:hypothetical protein